MISKRKARRVLVGAWILLLLMTLFANLASAQPAPINPDRMPDGVIGAYQAARAPAIAVFNRYAMRLFRALALVEMAWCGVILLLERSDLQGWTAGFIRKLMVLFFFFWLLQNGPAFSSAIVDSFTTIGLDTANLSGFPAIGVDPGDVFYRGGNIAFNMLRKADLTGFLLQPGMILVIVLAGIIIFLSFAVISIHLIMAQVESYIVVSAGLIFLGFGGNAVTRPYVERFFAMSVAVGVKLMVLYIVVGIGNNLSNTWSALANSISVTALPFQLCLDLVGGALIFAAVAWGVPKFAASILSGSPAFSGGDLIGMTMNAASGVLMASGGAALAAKGTAMVVGGGASKLAAASSVGGAAGGAGGGMPGGVGGAPKPPGGGGGGAPGGGGSSSGGSGGGNAAPRPASDRDGGGAYSPGQPTAPGGGGSGSPQSSPANASVTTASSSGSQTSTVAASSTGPASSAGSPGPAGQGSAGGGMQRSSNQVAPPSRAEAMANVARVAKTVENVAGGVASVAANGLKLAYFMQRVLPHEGHSAGGPPQANMHG